MDRSWERSFDLDRPRPAEAQAGERTPLSAHSAPSVSRNSPHSASVSPTARLAGDINASPEANGSHAFFDRLPGRESQSRDDEGAAEPVGARSMYRHAELSVTGQRLLQSCRDSQQELEELVAKVGKLIPAKRQSLRASGTHTRTTVGLMLNGCAIDNVLPAMAMHADLLKGDIIVKVDDQPTSTETVHKQLIGEDVPGTSVMLTVRRGHTERTAQLIRMANSDIADMRRVFEIFTNLKSRFPTISGEVDEVVTIWSEVVSGDALYRAQVANSMQRLQRESTEHLHELKTGLEGLERNNELIRDAFQEALAVEDRLADVKKQLMEFGQEVRGQLSVQATALKNATRERDNLKDSIVDARVLNQTHKGQLEALRVEGESIKERLRVVTEERDSSRLELDKIQGQHWELRDLVASDAERLRAVERELERARSEADRYKGQLMELRESYTAANEQLAQLQVEKRQLKADVDSTKGLMDELRKQLNEKKEAADTLHTELELRREELNRALGSLEALREEQQHAKAAHARVLEEKEQAFSDVDRTQGQLVEIRRMLTERAQRLEVAEILNEKLKRERELADASAAQARTSLSEMERRNDELLQQVAVCKAHKSEAEVITQELVAQRAQYNHVLQELAEYKQALERESLGRTNAVKEKEGLWEVHEQLLSKSAALQARLREADDSKSRLQELNVECAVLKDKLQFAKTEREELVSLRAKMEGQLQESRDRCSTLEEQLKTYQVETLSEKSALENMQGQVVELRDQLHSSVRRAKGAEENFAQARAELENVRGHMHELQRWKREYNENLELADSDRRTALGEAEHAKGQLDELRAQLSVEKQLRQKAESRNTAWKDEIEDSMTAELQTLQNRMAKMREQNKALLEEREKAEQERDGLEAQLSVLKADRGKGSRQEPQVRELHAQLVAKARETEMMKDAMEKAVAECESLKAQVAALRQQVEDAQDRSPKMTTLSRMLREQLTAKADALKLAEQERDAFKKELNALEFSLDITRQDLQASKKSYEREQRARRQAEEERDQARKDLVPCEATILELRRKLGRYTEGPDESASQAHRNRLGSA